MSSGRNVQHTRRVRDLLRADILADRFLDESLPSEDQLRADFHGSRGTVRDALRLLVGEKLIRRDPGRGTYVIDQQMRYDFAQAHGSVLEADVTDPHDRLASKVIDWSVVPATPAVARRLNLVKATPVLRIEYLAVSMDSVLAIATNYLAIPEATRMNRHLLKDDYFGALYQAGIDVGETTYVFNTGLADELDEHVIDVRAGDPVMTMDQTIFDPRGRPIGIAYGRMSRRLVFESIDVIE